MSTCLVLDRPMLNAVEGILSTPALQQVLLPQLLDLKQRGAEVWVAAPTRTLNSFHGAMQWLNPPSFTDLLRPARPADLPAVFAAPDAGGLFRLDQDQFELYVSSAGWDLPEHDRAAVALALALRGRQADVTLVTHQIHLRQRAEALRLKHAGMRLP